MKFTNENKGGASMTVGHQILKISDAEYNEDYGTISVKLSNKGGACLYKSFQIENEEGEIDEKGKNALDFFATKALGLKKGETYEETDLNGHYIEADVIENEYKKKKGNKFFLDIDLWKIEGAKGFGKKKASDEDDELVDLDNI